MNSLSFDSHTEEYFKNMQILKLDDLHKLNLAIHMFNELVINPNCRHFPRNSDTHSHQTRNRSHLSYIRYNRSETQS